MTAPGTVGETVGVAPVRLEAHAAPAVLPSAPGSVDQALSEVVGWPADLRPGHGRTAHLWELLATLGAADLAVARAVEPHLDALAILDQADLPGAAGTTTARSTWGVFAAESPTAHLTATRTPGGAWQLDGTKPWCSLADRLDAALVTAHLPGDGDRRGLFVVDLRLGGVSGAMDGGWVARGLHEIPSTPLRFDRVAATPVRDAGWYVDRPGFWWGAIGVAACWYGGAVGVARRVLDEARRRPDDQLLAMHLGAIDQRLASARAVLADAARAVDLSGAATDGGRRPEAGPGRDAGRVLAKRARAAVAGACEGVLHSAGHALGPGPLTQEDDHAKRVADLQVYVRQHHAERDDVSLGRALLARPGAPW